MAEAPESLAPRRRARPLIAFAGFALLGAAVLLKEIRTPHDRRAWHGTLGPVPYDLRPPTLDRARTRLLNPDGPLFGPNLFGVGWTVNFGRLLAMLRAKLDR